MTLHYRFNYRPVLQPFVATMFEPTVGANRPGFGYSDALARENDIEESARIVVYWLS